MKRPSQALIADWYAKLRATGFRDIEGGRDLNKLHASTFRGGDGTHGAAVALVDFVAETRDVWRPLADHPTAVYYRGLEHAARELRGKRRKLIMIASQGNLATAGRQLAINRKTAQRGARRFALSIGLLREARGS